MLNLKCINLFLIYSLILALSACGGGEGRSNSPVFTSGSTIGVNENTTITGYTATAIDEDGDVVTFSLTGGVDQTSFFIDVYSGELSFLTAPDFEMPIDSDSNNSYEVVITATDETHTVIQSITVTVSDTNDNLPVFSSGLAISVAENTTVTGYVATVTDGDGDSIMFSLTGGEDEAAFSIDSNSGELSFLTAPDFEMPIDSDSNNSYEVVITATDETHTVIQSITVTVSDTNDNLPVFSSGLAISVAENTTVTGYVATVTDGDGDSIMFSLTGGEDEAAFSIDSNSGELSFLTAPDFDSPNDSNANNTYVVEITATDGSSSIVQSVVVTVTNVFEVAASIGGIKTIKFDWLAYDGATSYKLFVNLDGVSGYSLLKDNIVSNSTSIVIPVHLTDWINSSYILEAHGISGKLTESPFVSITELMVASIGYVKASNTSVGRNDSFGYALSLSSDGSTLAVGAYGEWSTSTGINGDQDTIASVASGAVYVFSKSGSMWVQQAFVKASNTDSEDNFGHAVSLSADGNTMAVGAHREDSNTTGISVDGTGESDNSAISSGAVYIFSRSGSNWVQQAYVKTNNSKGGDWFGYSVSLSADGNTLAVGAGLASLVYTFKRSGDTWIQESSINASYLGGNFGFTINLSGDGNTLAVGAYTENSNATGVSTDGTGEDNNSSPNAGAVYVFNYNGSSWVQQAYVKASNTSTDNFFGYSVSLSADGNTLAVGAYGESRASTGINGDEAAYNPSIISSGAVYVFDRNGSTWLQQAYIKASNTGLNDRFGHSVSLSADSNTLAVGALFESSNDIGIDADQINEWASGSGAVYMFSRSGESWSQKSYVKASNTDKNDYFGYAISLSSDGLILSVGAYGEDSNATGINGDQTYNWSTHPSSTSGAVYLY